MSVANSSLPRILSAGAGSGKTYRLTEELALALDPNGASPARPEGVLATTFTRKAAAELCERARKALFAAGMPEQADRVAGGLVGTVNSVCGKLLARFAFEAGLSPELRVIDERDQALLFNQALGDAIESETIDEMNRLDDAFGYAASRGLDPEDRKDWRSRVRTLVDAARCNDLDAAALRASAVRSLASLLAYFPAPDPAGADAVDRDLRGAIERALRAIEKVDDDTKVTAGYAGFLRGVLSTLGHGHALPWSDWVKLAKQKPGTKCRAAAEPVIEAASRQAAHPRLRADVTYYVEKLFEIAAASLDGYQRWKRERGLVDFIDQEALTLELLRRPEVREVLRSELDVTFVDEFQDTSPIQLAVFLELVPLAKRSVWVGDPKQSIYAFRGADPELMGTVVAAVGMVRPEDILDRSRRSRPPLVDWTSEVFASAFAGRWPREQIVLAATRKEMRGLPAPLQAWVLPVGNNTEEAAAIAEGVATLLGRRGTRKIGVVDRDSKEVRGVEPGDVAVLCKTNDHCVGVAAALERAGVRAALAQVGLLATPEAILALAAVKLLVDGRDTLARAEVVALTHDDPEPETWLAERLEHVAAERPVEEWAAANPVVCAVERIRAELDWLTPAEVLDRVIRVVDLPRLVLGWGRGALRLGNLEALRRAVAAYEDHCDRRGPAATVAGMLAWLDTLANAREDQQSEGIGKDAVAVLTWHGAKGLEWPVVVVADLDKEPGERLFEPVVVGERDKIDLRDPLAGRWIRFWPWPYGGQQKDVPLGTAVASSAEQAKAEAAAEDEFLRLLYVALTRARDVLVLPARPKKDGALSHAALDRLFVRGGKTRFVLPVKPGKHIVAVDGSSVSIEVETRVFEPGDPVAADAAEEVWFPPAPPDQSAVRPPARIAASRLGSERSSGEASSPPLEVLDVGPRLTLTGDPDERLLGNALHSFLAADDADLCRDDAARAELAVGLLRRHGIPGAVQPAELLTRSLQLRHTLLRRYVVNAWHREWPMQLRREDGTVVTGFADLVLDTSDGWVIVDHKSFKGRRDQWAAKAAEYETQLAAYAEAMRRATGRGVVGVWVHFVVGGGLISRAVGRAGLLRKGGGMKGL